MMEENSSSPAHRSDVGNSNSTENGSTMEKKGVPDIIPMQDYNIKKVNVTLIILQCAVNSTIIN